MGPNSDTDILYISYLELEISFLEAAHRKEWRDNRLSLLCYNLAVSEILHTM